MAPPRPGLCGAQGQALGCGAAQLQHPQLHHGPLVLRWGWGGQPRAQARQQAGQGWHRRGSFWHHPRQGQGGSPPAGGAHARLLACQAACETRQHRRRMACAPAGWQVAVRCCETPQTRGCMSAGQCAAGTLPMCLAQSCSDMQSSAHQHGLYGAHRVLAAQCLCAPSSSVPIVCTAFACAWPAQPCMHPAPPPARSARPFTHAAQAWGAVVRACAQTPAAAPAPGAAPACPSARQTPPP